MRIVNLNQNTVKWKDWRGRGVGASDAPAIMGESPWTTPLECWLDKTGLREKPEFNAFAIVAMRRGQELEPKARELFEKQHGTAFPAVSAEHKEYAFIRASFDGYNEQENAILEIKCPGKVDHEKAVKGNLPGKYRAQVQQQLLVSGAEKCYYVSWDGQGDEIVVLEVLPDPKYQEELLNALIDFWDKVTTLTMPPVSREDALKFAEDVQKKQQALDRAIKVLNLIISGEVPSELKKESK